MLLVGSLAAKLTVCLPPSRLGFVNDIDIHGDEADAQLIQDNLGYPTNLSGAAPRWLISGRISKAISITEPNNLTDLLLLAPDTETMYVPELNTTMAVIGPQSQLALKLGYLSLLMVHFAKNKRDIEHWVATLDPEDWHPIHNDIMLAIRHKVMQDQGRQIYIFEGTEEHGFLTTFLKPRNVSLMTEQLSQLPYEDLLQRKLELNRAFDLKSIAALEDIQEALNMPEVGAAALIVQNAATELQGENQKQCHNIANVLGNFPVYVSMQLMQLKSMYPDLYPPVVDNEDQTPAD